MRARRRLIAIALVAGCSPQRDPTPGHFVVHVRTDATVPGDEAAGYLPVFDTLRIELLGEAGICVGCERDIPLDAERLRRDLTFTVRSRSSAVVRLRVRMFRAAAPPEVAPDACVDVWTALGAQPGDGEQRDVMVTLPVDAVGSPIGNSDAPRAGEPATPFLARPPLWPAARLASCGGSPGAHEVCIPGGAFWMGNVAADPVFGMNQPRLVVVAPYFLDAHEMTVAEYRRLADPEKSEAGVFSGQVTGDSFEDFCTLTREPGLNETYPINCLGWGSARLACRARGNASDLPTEAQWEYAASKLVSLPRVWGYDVASCADAVTERGPQRSSFNTLIGACRPASSPGVDERSVFGWPEPAVRANHGRDTLLPPGATVVVVDLMGNVAEWVRDYYHSLDEACWSSPALRVDPSCLTPSRPDRSFVRSVRGGAWHVPRAQANAHLRTPLDGTTRTDDWIGIGFRCVRSAPQ